MTDETIPRRKFLVGASIASTAVAAGMTQSAPAEGRAAEAPAQPAAAPAAPTPEAEPLLLLNDTEHAFIVAAVDTMIPADEL